MVKDVYKRQASTGVAVIVLLVIVGSCMIFALPKFKKLQQLTDDLNRVTRENLTGDVYKRQR